MALITWLSERVGHIIVFAMLKETICVTLDLTQLSPGKKGSQCSFSLYFVSPIINVFHGKIHKTAAFPVSYAASCR